MIRNIIAPILKRAGKRTRSGIIIISKRGVIGNQKGKKLYIIFI